MKTLPLLFALLALGFTGCGQPPPEPTPESAAARPGDFVNLEEATPAQRRCLDFGREVMLALAARDYAKFHAQLSTHARARMSLNQFDPAEDDHAFEANERAPRRDVTLEQFHELMARCEARHGAPARPLDLHLHSDEPNVLAGKTDEETGTVEIMFAIGNMPESVPVAIRRASLRGRILVTLPAERLAAVAKEMNTTAEALGQDPDFKPYFTVKLVLVEEQGRLSVGYFEFLPPSMMD